MCICKEAKRLDAFFFPFFCCFFFFSSSINVELQVRSTAPFQRRRRRSDSSDNTGKLIVMITVGVILFPLGAGVFDCGLISSYLPLSLATWTRSRGLPDRLHLSNASTPGSVTYVFKLKVHSSALSCSIPSSFLFPVPFVCRSRCFCCIL